METKSKFLISSENPPILKKWHGTNGGFTSAITSFYQDSTIEKAVFLKEKLDLSIEQLYLKQNLLHLQTEIRTNAQTKRKMQEKWEEMVESEISNHKFLISQRHLAAITIQRHIRGFLARILTEQDIIDIKDRKLNALISESSIETLNIMLNLGAILVPATILIQKAYKRYLVRCRIFWLRKCFQKHLFDKDDAACKIIKKGISMMVHHQSLKAIGFIKIRERKLKIIRQKLAILTVKEFWKSRKLTFKQIKEKIQRIKRRQAALQNKEAYAKYLNSLGGKLEKKQTFKISGGSDEEKRSEGESPGLANNADELDEEEYLEAQRIKELIQKRIRDKLDKSKLAHAITDSKQVMVLPLMQEKALKESPSEEGKLQYITMSVFAKGRSLSREIKKPSRNTLVGSPANYEHKRLYHKQDLSHLQSVFTPTPDIKPISPLKNLVYADFMATTISYKRKNQSDYRPIRKKDLSILPLSTNLIIPTISHSMKRKEKKTMGKTNSWSIKNTKEHYTPSLSNYSYTPVPWRPVPLNKNILVNTDYGKTMSRGRSNFKYNVVDFTSRMLTPDLPKLYKEYPY